MEDDERECVQMQDKLGKKRPFSKGKVRTYGKSRIKRLLWNGSAVAALLAALAVFAVLLQIEKNTLADYEKGLVYVAAKEIPKGQMITQENYREYVAECMLDVKCIPKTAITDPGQISGLVAQMEIEEGCFLTLGMFELLNEITSAMKEPVIVGLRAEDVYQVVGGTLRAGDRIHIYCVDADDMARLVWKNIFVYQAFDNAGAIISNADRKSAAQRINVYMENAEVESFYTELASGSLRVVKVCD